MQQQELRTPGKPHLACLLSTSTQVQPLKPIKKFGLLNHPEMNSYLYSHWACNRNAKGCNNLDTWNTLISLYFKMFMDISDDEKHNILISNVALETVQ